MRDKSTLVVLPARGGSKRIPRKNLELIGTDPMIGRTISIVQNSSIGVDVIVSTDDDEIASVAERYGALVPFKRPVELADDHTPTAPVVAHAVEAYNKLVGRAYDTVMVVYPTACLLVPADLQHAVAVWDGDPETVVMAVGEYPMPVQRAWRVNDDGRGTMLHPEHALTRTQDLEPAFFDAGQFYLSDPTFWSSGLSLADVRPLLVELPRSRSVDIDTPDDLELVRAIVATL